GPGRDGLRSGRTDWAELGRENSDGSRSNRAAAGRIGPRLVGWWTRTGLSRGDLDWAAGLLDRIATCAGPYGRN
ncbi:hypothetical protein CRG98_048242, partial [Punica granatum]